jgi:hypothetical protein
MCEFVTAKLYLQVREQKSYNYRANNWASQSIEIKVKEKNPSD